MSNVDINVDRRTDGRTENRTPISHPATSSCDKNYHAIVIFVTFEPKHFLWKFYGNPSVRYNSGTNITIIIQKLIIPFILSYVIVLQSYHFRMRTNKYEQEILYLP